MCGITIGGSTTVVADIGLHVAWGAVSSIIVLGDKIGASCNDRSKHYSLSKQKIFSAMAHRLEDKGVELLAIWSLHFLFAMDKIGQEIVKGNWFVLVEFDKETSVLGLYEKRDSLKMTWFQVIYNLPLGSRQL